jgi:hypothetical protein
MLTWRLWLICKIWAWIYDTTWSRDASAMRNVMTYLVTCVLYWIDVFDDHCFFLFSGKRSSSRRHRLVRKYKRRSRSEWGGKCWLLYSCGFKRFCATHLHVHAEIYRAADVVFCVLPAYITEVIPRSLQLQVHVLASLGSCQKSGQCAKSRARRSVCLCRAVKEPVFFCCYHVTEIGGP